MGSREFTECHSGSHLEAVRVRPCSFGLSDLKRGPVLSMDVRTALLPLT